MSRSTLAVALAAHLVCHSISALRCARSPFQLRQITSRWVSASPIRLKNRRGTFRLLLKSQTPLTTETGGKKVEDLVPIEPKTEKNTILRAKLKGKLCGLREIVAFQKVPEELDEVINQMRLHVIPSGTRIFQQGEAGDRMYIVETGSVDIFKESEDSDGKKEEVRVSSYLPGECVGHLSLLDARPRAASAIARKNSVLWSIDRKTLLDFMSKGSQAVAGTDPVSSEEEDECVLPREVLVVSDSTGESAVSAVKNTISQFSHCNDWEMCNIMTYRFVSTEKEMEHVVEQAKRTDAMIVFTLVNRNMNQFLQDTAIKNQVPIVDLYGPLISKFEEVFGTEISGTPGRRQKVDEDYMDIMDCIEYTRRMDDGVNPSEWHRADLIIVGPSRAGKTPLSFYLSLRGFKVANYPIVIGEEPPKELFEFKDRVVALTIAPERLAYIRGERMKQFGRLETRYASLAEIKDEMRQIERLYKHNPSWLILDTTNTGLEESAAEIFKKMDQRSGTTTPQATRARTLRAF
ncbi:hypothetical protein AAMO2058_000065900 [Amorphochlora amoebiformis]